MEGTQAISLRTALSKIGSASAATICSSGRRLLCAPGSTAVEAQSRVARSAALYPARATPSRGKVKHAAFSSSQGFTSFGNSHYVKGTSLSQLSSVYTRGTGRQTFATTSAAEAAVESPQTKAEGGADAAAKTERRKRVLSGVQPTGSLHLGNYLGAIRNWVDLQEQYDTYFCVVDLHAITNKHDPRALLQSTRSSAATYIACGIDPERATVFVQSHVRAHSELAWLLNCATPIGWLERMIQFKEKSKSQGEDVTVGLLDYPVLMAADILLYQADLVPVGEDQRQHLELTRDIADRVNHLYGGKKWKKLGGRGGRILRVPDALIPPTGARVMSLVDGTSKMSKSAEAEGSRINLTDTPDQIAKKIKRCKTDAFEGLSYDKEARPEATNLLGIYELMTGKTKEEVLAECGAMRWGDFKPILADATIEHLRPIQERFNEVMEDPTYLDSVLAKGAEVASAEADQTLFKVRQAMGFMVTPP